MAFAEKIRIALVKRGNMSEAELARRLGVSPQTLNNKMARDNFKESDLREIAGALGLAYEANFVNVENGERI